MATITGTGGGEFLGGTDDADTIDALDGNDRVWGRAGNDVIRGGAGNDILIGEAGFNLPEGFDVVSVGDDMILGDDGNDVVVGGRGNDQLFGGDGDDRLYQYVASAEFDTFGISIDAFFGGPDGGADFMDGGAGIDGAYWSFATRSAPVSFELGGPTGISTFFVNGVASGSVTGIEYIDVFGGSGDDTITGGSGPDSITGGSGTNTLTGGGDRDLLTSSAASINDVLIGGDGDDEYYVSSDTATIVEQPGGGRDTLHVLISRAEISLEGANANIENLDYGGTSGARLIGNAADNFIWGGRGNDVLEGRSGADILGGGQGDDTYVVDGNDVIFELPDGAFGQGPGGNDTVQASMSYALPDRGPDGQGEVENLVLTGAASINGTGNRLANVLAGTEGANILAGLSSPDTLNGGAGNDFLYGESSSDILLTSNALTVRRLYLATLDRAPDPVGWAAWTAQLDAGVPLATITSGFIQSPEFLSVYGSLNNTQFVTLLYDNVLKRAPDPAGLNGWLGVLNSGGTREGVVNGFSQSPEFQSTSDTANHGAAVYRIYGATLDRAPDPVGFAGWTNVLANNGTLDEVAGGFVNSMEFQTVYGALDNTQFVTLLYANVLERAPDPAGLNGWLGVLAGGGSRTSVVLGFSQSGEYQAATRAGYVAFATTNFAPSNDRLDGGAGDDLLSGGEVADTFVFTAGQGGTDRIYGFETIDEVNLVGFGYASAAEAQARLTQVGADVVFADQGETIVFQNFALANFNPDQWLLG